MLPSPTPRLQRALGNGAYGRLLQAKLTVGAPNDPYEREAEHVADQVMRTPEPVVQRACHCGGSCASCQDEDHLQRAPAADETAPAVAPRVAAGIEGLRGGGEPLGRAERSFFEPRFGYDFGPVRVHTGSQAAALAGAVQARAFTLGSDVVFGRGEYAPATPTGRHLIAHELTHAVQQGAVAARRAPQTSADASLEMGREKAGEAGRIQRLPGPPMVQRVRLTQGQFGREMEHYQQEVGVPDRPFQLIWRSSTFRNLIAMLDRHYVSLAEPSLPTSFEVGAGGELVNDPVLNGRWAGSGRRVIHLFTSGVDESSAFEPASRSTWPYDMMWLYDIYYWSAALGRGMSDVEKDGTFIEALAHETTHAHNLVTGAGPGAAGPNPGLAASIAASIQEEIRTRRQEEQVLSEVRRGGRLRGFAPTPGGTATREVERSMVSGTPRRTYLEAFFFSQKLGDALQHITDDEARRLERIVRDIPLTAATADRYLDRNELILYFDSSSGIYELLDSDYGKWLFWQRVIDQRWKAFEALASPPATAKERILQEHATAYFDPGVAYTP